MPYANEYKATEILDLATELGIDMPQTRLAIEIKQTAAIGASDPGDTIRQLARDAVNEADTPEAVSANLLAAAAEASMLIASAELVNSARTSMGARIDKAVRSETEVTLTAAADIAKNAMTELSKVIGKLPTDWRTNPDAVVDNNIATEFRKARTSSGLLHAVYELADALLGDGADALLLFHGPDEAGHRELVELLGRRTRIGDLVERYARGKSALTFEPATTRDEYKRRNKDAYATRKRELADQVVAAKNAKQAGGPQRAPLVPASYMG